MALKQSTTRYKQRKKQMFDVTRPTKLLKISFLFLVTKKGQKRDESEFVTKLVGIIVTINFI